MSNRKHCPSNFIFKCLVAFVFITFFIGNVPTAVVMAQEVQTEVATDSLIEESTGTSTEVPTKVPPVFPTETPTIEDVVLSLEPSVTETFSEEPSAQPLMLIETQTPEIVQESDENRSPEIISISPSKKTVGSESFILTITGRDLEGGFVYWNGDYRETTFVSDTELSAIIPSSDLANPGLASITVLSEETEARVSNAINFTINNPTPELTSISPNSKNIGEDDFSISVYGFNFLEDTQVKWNGVEQDTTFVSNNEVVAQITGEEISCAGTAYITVSNPGSIVEESNSLEFIITNDDSSGTGLRYENTDFGISFNYPDNWEKQDKLDTGLSIFQEFIGGQDKLALVIYDFDTSQFSSLQDLVNYSLNDTVYDVEIISNQVREINGITGIETVTKLDNEYIFTEYIQRENYIYVLNYLGSDSPEYPEELKIVLDSIEWSDLLQTGLISQPDRSLEQEPELSANGSTVSSMSSTPTLTFPFRGTYKISMGYYNDSSGIAHANDTYNKYALDFIDNSGTTLGDPVYSVFAGTVYGLPYEANGCGNFVKLRYSGNSAYTTYYCHLKSFNVSLNQSISQGYVVGYAGATGYVTGPHIHFAYLYNSSSVLPEPMSGYSNFKYGNIYTYSGVTKPSAPTSVAASDGTYTDKVRITWNSSAGATEYIVLRNTVDSKISATRFSGITGTSYNDTSADVGTTYYYWVWALNDAGGNVSDYDFGWRASAVAVPSAPTGVSASDGTYFNKIQVTWNPSAGATKYIVLRNTIESKLSATRFYDITETFFDDSSAELDTTYYYWVWAVNDNNEGSISDYDFGWRATSPLAPPAPTDVTASDGTYTDKVFLTWNNVTDADYYEIWRNTTNVNSSAFLIAENVYSNSYEDTSGSVGETYYYWIKACSNSSALCSESSITDSGYSFIQPKPGRVILSGPAKNLITNDTELDLEWYAVDYGETYHVQVSTNSKFTAIVEEEEVDQLTHKLGEIADGMYYWRVRAKNIQDVYGAWSDMRYFTLDTTAPDTPSAIYPADDSSVIGIPIFKWSRPSTAKYYQFRYANLEEPDTIIYISDEMTEYTFKPASLNFMNTYVWSVRAADVAGNWSDWGSPVTVTIVPPVPAKTTLTSPSNKYLTNDHSIEFTWNAIANGESYHLQISSNSRFKDSTLVIDEEDLTNLTYTVENPSETFLNDGKYYWRVQAANANDVYGSWSSARYFTLDTIAPSVPILSFPYDGGQVIGTPAFKWKKSSGAVRYEFQYNTENRTDSAIHNSGLINRYTYTPPKMDTGVPYYWFVRAYDSAGNASEWSEPFTVTILAPIPRKPELDLPNNGVYTNDNEPELSWLAADYAVSYDVQISTSSRFKNGSIVSAIEEQAGLTFTPTEILADGKYYWRVRARNENGEIGGWSKSRYFTIDTIQPVAPALRSPVDGISVTGKAIFKWYAVPGGKYYQLAYGLEDDPDLASYTSDWITNTSLTISNMEANTTYYWFVRAKDLAGNISAEWSDSRNLTFLPPTPARVSVVSPVNGYIPDENDLTLIWNSVPYGTTYQVQIDESSSFRSPVDFVSDSEVPTYDIHDIQSGRWYWHVRACNINNKCGSWSSRRYFTINPGFDS
jgi:murein DD-endopeptidase MepM/ murein hydrolase activator NlpD